jgi:hypothetical protein
VRALAGTAIAGLAFLSGCYGSTEPATNVGVISATFNGAGNTESSPTTAWFEYGRTPSEGFTRTKTVSLPSGVRGPLKITVGGLQDVREARLLPNTEYRYRLCGAPEGGEAVCAQTRTFRTQEGDVVDAQLHAGAALAFLLGVSGPNGESPNGLFDVAPLGSTDERVVCVSVHGDEAVIGSRAPSGSSQRTVGLLAGVDHLVTQDMDRDPSKCAQVRRSDMPFSTITADTSIHDGS